MWTIHIISVCIVAVLLVPIQMTRFTHIKHVLTFLVLYSGSEVLSVAVSSSASSSLRLAQQLF